MLIIRRETSGDALAIHTVQDAAFDGMPYSSGTEAALVDALRASPDWIAPLSMVAELDGTIVGHVVCSRGHIGDKPALGLGPIGVDPSHQGHHIGAALLHAVIAAADALGEPAIVLLGDPALYSRFGFVMADTVGVTPPDPAWTNYFQVRTLTAYRPDMQGRFTYAKAFDIAS